MIKLQMFNSVKSGASRLISLPSLGNLFMDNVIVQASPGAHLGRFKYS